MIDCYVVSSYTVFIFVKEKLTETLHEDHLQTWALQPQSNSAIIASWKLKVLLCSEHHQEKKLFLILCVTSGSQNYLHI